MSADRRWQHFDHQADIGVRGFGRSKAEAFANAAVALTAVICETDKIEAKESVHFHCTAGRDDVLLVDWLNALIFEMATRGLLFARFDVSIEHGVLEATAWGEPIDAARHVPAIEVKGATYTELRVRQTAPDAWVAQTVVDV